MAEVKVVTGGGREIIVRSAVTARGAGDVILKMHDTIFSEEILSRLTAVEAAEIGNALLLAAAGKLSEPKYYLQIITEDHSSYVNQDREDGQLLLENRVSTSAYQTQFTQAEIDADEKLKKFEAFKIPVPVSELDG